MYSSEIGDYRILEHPFSDSVERLCTNLKVLPKKKNKQKNQGWKTSLYFLRVSKNPNWIVTPEQWFLLACWIPDPPEVWKHIESTRQIIMELHQLMGMKNLSIFQVHEWFLSSVQWLTHVRLFVSPWITARQAFQSIPNSQSLLKLMPIKWVMPSNHLILCHPCLLLPSIFSSIRVFSNESVLHIRWPKY